MTPRKEILFLVQVALPFALLGSFKHPGFFAPVALIVLSLPWGPARRKLIAGWQGLGHLLGRIVSPVVLSALYYLALTPLALLRRLFGADELLLKKPATSTLQEVRLSHPLTKFEDLW